MADLQKSIEIGLTPKDRDGVTRILNVLLSDEYLLYTKTWKFHWNVTGLSFHDLHLFLEAQYGELDGFVDDVAEHHHFARAEDVGRRPVKGAPVNAQA